MGPAIAAVADSVGQPLMPWQQLVADVGGELLENGRPAYRQVVVTVPRQSGKTTLLLAWEVHRALGWAQLMGERQRIVYSAQTGKDAREKLVEDQHPILERNKRLLGIKTLRVAAGSEGVLWKNGSRLGLMGGTDSAGHGKTVDLAVEDELFADQDFRRDQALDPAMVTRSYAQKLIASTMGTDDSTALNAVVSAGRAAVEDGRTSGIAYFEWAADLEDDPGDPAVWWRCMPALGRTIDEDVIRHHYDQAVAQNSLGEFQRAYLNIPTAADERVIPQSAWNAACGDYKAEGDRMFAVDVNWERSAASIVAIGRGPVLEVVDYRPGLDWVVERCVQLRDQYRGAFALDRAGPVGALVDELKRRRVRLVELEPRDVQRSCAFFYDRVIQGSVRIRRDKELDAAVACAARRDVADAYVWTRKNSTGDISLLFAASVGVFAWSNKAKPRIVSMAEAYERLEAE